MPGRPELKIGSVRLWSCIWLAAPLVAQSFDLEAHLRAAQAAEQQKDYERAGSQYRQILEHRPKLALIRQSLALTLHLGNRFPEAIREFELAVAADPSLWGSHLFLGVALYKTNEFARAAASLRRSMALNAQAEPEGRFWLGMCHAALGQPQDAVRELRRAAQLRPGDIEVLYQLAQAHQQAAAQVFGRIGQANPDAAVVRLLQAERYLTDGRRDLAENEYRAAIGVRPDLAGSIAALQGVVTNGVESAIGAADARTLWELVSLYRDIGEEQPAWTLLAHLRAAKTTAAEAARYVALARQANGAARTAVEPGVRDGLRLLAAGKPCEAAAVLEPVTRESVILFRARALAECNKTDEAEAVLVKILHRPDALWWTGRCHQLAAAQSMERMAALNPESYRVKQMQGERFEEATEYGKAIESYRQAMEANPELGGIRYAIGNTYRKQRNHSEAIGWLNDELKLNPHHGLSHLRLGSIYLEEPGGAEKAVKHLEAAQAARTGSNLVWLELGRAYLAQNRNADALAALRKFAVAEPFNDRVHFLLANAYRKLGRAAEASAELKRYEALSRERLTKVQEDVRGLTSDGKK